MEKDIPKIDLLQGWVIGKFTAGDIGLLNLYIDYLCRPKAGAFVFCLSGEAETSTDLTQFKVEPGNFISILPGSIFQAHKVGGDLQIYSVGFSSSFLEKANVSKSVIDIHYTVKENPIYKPKEKALPLLKDHFELLIKAYGLCGSQLSRSVINHLFTGILMGVSTIYKNQTADKQNPSKTEQASKNFTQLVMQNYTMQRSVAWYVKRFGITQAHLSSIIKQTAGKTCVEIITSMVIMGAKVQLKSTNLSIYDIAYTLNFTNMSSFGKYLKHHMGMSPQEYQNS